MFGFLDYIINLEPEVNITYDKRLLDEAKFLPVPVNCRDDFFVAG